MTRTSSRNHRPSRAAGAAAFAAILLAAPLTAVAAPAAAAPSASDTAVAISDGSLTWGIKESWRTYVGAEFTSVEGGASWTDDGLFSFPLSEGSYDEVTRTTTLSFAGSVHFEGYCTDVCLLDTRYGNLTVEIGPSGQTVTGDWAGRLQEDPAAGIETRTGVTLATLDIGGITPDGDTGATRWAAIPSAAADGFVTYPAGTRLDPVSIEYAGPGGAPDLAERWDSPGAPRYEAGAQWVSDKRESNARIAYPLADGSSLIIVQGATGEIGATEHTVFATDPVTLEPVGEPLRIPETGGVAMPRTAFDAEEGAVFWPALDGGVVAVNRSVWNPTDARFDTARIGQLPEGAVALGSAQITSFAWNPIARQLAVASGDFSFTDPQSSFTVFGAAEGGEWSVRSGSLDLPADLRAQYAGALRVLIPFGTSSLAPNLAPLPDGSYVLAGGGAVSIAQGTGSDATSSPIPAFRITVGDAGVAVTAIPGSEPEQPSGGFAHGHASVTADGTVVLSSSLGAYRPVTLVDGVAVAGDEFTLDVGGNVYASPTVAADAVTGLTLTTNMFAKKLIAFRDGRLLGAQDMPLINGFYPAPLTVGPDGSVYQQIRTGDGLGGIQRQVLVGTVPEITAQPEAVVVDTASGDQAARFTVAATASPEPSIQWQSKPAGQSAFSDIDGATGFTLERPVVATDDGTVFRAVASSPAGAVASEPAELTVLSAPVFVQQPVAQTVEPGATAVFQVLVSGNPEPDIAWERRAPGGWEPIVSGGAQVTGPRLAIEDVRESASVRAVAGNDHGSIASNAVALTVASPIVNPDGSVTGIPNAVGASTTVSPGVELASDGSARLTVTGSSFAKNTNTSGLYALFGYVDTFPSAGGGNGSGYAYIDGEDNQRFVAWPGAATAGAANALFGADGSFQVDGLVAAARFSAAGTEVDCLDGTVRCGVMTIGAHGQRDANLETFTPVYFADEGTPPVTEYAPSVVAQPAGVSAPAGADAKLTAAATGFPAPQARWQVLRTGENEWADVEDAGGGTPAGELAAAAPLEGSASSTTLVLRDVRAEQDGWTYRVVFTNTAGEAVTEAARVTVTEDGVVPMPPEKPVTPPAKPGVTPPPGSDAGSGSHGSGGAAGEPVGGLAATGVEPIGLAAIAFALAVAGISVAGSRRAARAGRGETNRS